MPPFYTRETTSSTANAVTPDIQFRFNILRSLFATLSILAFTPVTSAASAEFTSTYIDVSPEGCKAILHEPEDEPAWGEQKCKAPNGSLITITDFDARLYVSYGDSEDNGAPNFGAFNNIGKKLEWITRHGKPHATILRWYLDTDAYSDSEQADSNGRLKAQVLKITKLAPNGESGCTMAFVDATANRNANELARQAAYSADNFVCGTDQPYTLGKLKFLFQQEADSMGLDQSRSR